MSQARGGEAATPLEGAVDALVDGFMRSGRCPERHREHARSTLALVASFLVLAEEVDSRGLPWHRLSPDAFVDASLECDSEHLGFLSAVLDLTASFYDYLTSRGVLRRDEALGIRRRLVELSLGLVHS